MTQWHIGTIGFGYKEWRGVFYPEGMQQRSYLPHYAQFFNAVEIDSTRYGIPDVDSVMRWGEESPEDFTFCPKTPQAITHDARLRETAEAMAEFVERMQLLGEKLGPIFVQLPPNFTTAEEEIFGNFLAQLPTSARYAVEFRHRSWERVETAEILRQYNICWLSADYTIMPKVVHPTTDFAFLRLLGRHGRYLEKNWEQRDPTADLELWLEQLTPHLPQFKHIYAFFNNDFAGYSPKSANRFKELIGMETAAPDIPKQPRLL